MELLDVLDEQGKPIGITKTKADIHRTGDWHKSVDVWIINSKQELLLQKRAAVKENYPNHWDISVAGHVSAGELPLDAAIREIHEELGLQLDAQDFEYLFTVTQQAVINGDTYIENEFNDVFLMVRDLDISTLRLQKEEVGEVKFIPWRELEELMKENESDFVPHPEEYEMLFAELSKRF